MVWLVLAGMAACAVLAALWPLLRPSRNATADPAANEAAFYKAQLEEIRRDVERGLLPQGEADGPRGGGTLGGAAAGAAHASRSCRADRRRTAGDRLSPLCAPRPTHAARRAVGEPQSRAADGRRD